MDLGDDSMSQDDYEANEILKHIPEKSDTAKLSELRHETIRALMTLEPTAQFLGSIDYEKVTGLPDNYSRMIEYFTEAVRNLRNALEASDFRK
jgi:hypothetical protein